jgi:hypothetical protein
MSSTGRTLIVGGQTWDISEFDIFEHVKPTDPLQGRLQYRLRSKGWWGPMVGYKLVRYVVTVKYTKGDHTRWFEVTITCTLAAEADPGDLDDSMMDRAVDILESWGADVPWDEIEVKSSETILQTDRFDSSIHITAVDMDQHKTVVEGTWTWTEEDMRHEAGLD